jgi:hypothetical protein
MIRDDHRKPLAHYGAIKGELARGLLRRVTAPAGTRPSAKLDRIVNRVASDTANTSAWPSYPVAHSNQVRRETDFQGRDEEAEKFLNLGSRRCRDKILLTNPANSGLIAEN